MSGYRLDAADVRILQRAPIFHGLGESDLAELRPALKERRFRRGEAAWVEGDPATDLFVVVEGQFKSYRVSRDGAELILTFNSAIDVMGEVGVFHPSGRRQVSVSAQRPGRCLLVARAPLLSFMTRHPVVMERMLERLSTTTVRTAFAFSVVAFEDIRRRVARTLLVLGEEYGEEANDGVRIRLWLSQGSLAALVAASRENVNRALSSLIAAGAVSQHDGHFVLHDRAALQRASADYPAEL